MTGGAMACGRTTLFSAAWESSLAAAGAMGANSDPQGSTLQ